MRIYLFIFLFSFCVISVTSGQKFYTKTGHVHFLSEAPIETIQSDNNNAYVVLDGASGQFEFSVLIKGFNFEKALTASAFSTLSRLSAIPGISARTVAIGPHQTTNQVKKNLSRARCVTSVKPNARTETGKSSVRRTRTR